LCEDLADAFYKKLALETDDNCNNTEAATTTTKVQLNRNGT